MIAAVWISLRRIFGITLCLLAVIYVGVFHRHEFNTVLIENTVLSSGLAGPFIFILIYVLATVLFLPSLIITLSGGFIFGFLWGSFVNVIGANIGAFCTFLFARYLSKEHVRKRPQKRLSRLIKRVEKEGWRYVAFARLMPVLPFNFLNYAFGLTNIKLREYTMASFIFMLPSTMIYTYIGSLGRIAYMKKTEYLMAKGFLALFALSLLGLIPLVIRYYRQKEFQFGA